MPKLHGKIEELLAENERLKERLRETEEVLGAIQCGEADALVISGPDGDQVYTLTGADRAYRILFETMNEGAAILSQDGTVFFSNVKFCSMLRSRPETMLGGSLFRFVTEADRTAFEAFLALGMNEPQKKEFGLISQDGNVVPCHLSTSPFLIDGSSNICMVVTDLTDRKMVEEDLVRSNSDLQQFAYVASHDLQEPLRNVATCMQMLEKKYKARLDAEADQYIHHAVEAVVRMKALIRDLLAYSRIGTQGKTPEPTDCEQLLAETIENLRSAMTESGALVTHDALPIIEADATQLMQVFQNLIWNAIKFKRDEPPQIHVSAMKREDEWIFSIRDNGIGIESRHLDRIFVIFQRLHSSSRYDGTGIGLAIVKKVVERHVGRVWAESEPGRGSTFFFTMPEKGRQI